MGKKVVVGGTFDHLHRGHEKLLKKAVRESEGGRLTIGLVSDEMLEERKPEAERSYGQRKEELEKFLDPYENWSIEEINDPYQKAVEGDFDCLVVSYETKKRGEEINRMREEKGKPPLELVEVKPVLAEDLLPINSTRIRKGEINREGERDSSVKLHLGSKNEVKKEAVEEVFSDYFDFELECAEVEGVEDQPFNEEIVRGARKRAEVPEGFDYGIGIESGILETEGGPFSLEYVVIKDKLGFSSTAHGPGFPTPKSWVEDMKKGVTLGRKLRVVFEESRESIGAVGLLTNGRVKRKDCIKSACHSAMIPRLNADLYY
ncbi:MAG: pantetheine-phosphate adenylyltransferase [Candidatus Natronoplasma sp.]